MVVTAVVKYRQKLITSRCLWVLSQTVKQIFRMTRKILIFLKFTILLRLLLPNLNFNLFFIDSVYQNFIQFCLNRKSTLEIIIIIIIIYFLSTRFTDNGRLLQVCSWIYIGCGATHFLCYSCIVERRMIMRPSRSVHCNGRSTYILITNNQF